MAVRFFMTIGIGFVCVFGAADAGRARASAPEFRRSVIQDMSIPQPLTQQSGNADRGLRIALDRAKGNCVTCHELPMAVDFPGNLGPPLAGVAERYTPAELRLRLVDSKQINPDSNMPSYHRVDGLVGVRRAFVGQPILTAQEVEDVLAYLLTLR